MSCPAIVLGVTAQRRLCSLCSSAPSRSSHSRSNIPSMFCPKCRTEYRPGFTRCADCDVDLVDSLPSQPAPADDDRAVVVWSGNDPVAFGAALAAMQTENIPHHVISAHDQYASVAPFHVPQYEILVPSEDVSRAEDVIRKALEPNPSE